MAKNPAGGKPGGGRGGSTGAGRPGSSGGNKPGHQRPTPGGTDKGGKGK